MNVFDFYNNEGWEIKSNLSKDAELFEDNRLSAREYISKCRKRLQKYIPNKGINFLDFASGPIQYKEYLDYSKNYKFRHCVDFSRKAIKEAKKKLKKKGKYYCNDFFKVNFKKNFFDCIVSLHTIYHIKKNYQKKAIIKLLEISKKNSPVIIVYSNPNCLISKIKNFLKISSKKKGIYFFCHNNEWWNQFRNLAHIEMYPWRSFSSGHQKLLFPDNYVGTLMLKILFFLEDYFKNFFVKNFQYQIIILRKK